jgi:hypothetical protein
VGNTFEATEFTDGINEIFFGGRCRWIGQRWTPYVGFGVGFAFPHVGYEIMSAETLLVILFAGLIAGWPGSS